MSGKTKSSSIETSHEHEGGNVFVSVPLDNQEDTESSDKNVRNDEEKPMKQDKDSQEKENCSSRWTRWIEAIHKPIMRGMLAITHHAATNPKSYVIVIIILSIAMLIVGFATNFTDNTDDDVWAPKNSRPVRHGEWIDDESGFPDEPRAFLLVVHNNGENLLGGEEERELAQEGVSRVFEALDAVRSVKGYDELCADHSNPNPDIDPETGNVTCSVVGITSFWNSSVAIYQDQVSTDMEAAEAMSADTYPDGVEVDFKQIIGYAGFDANGTLNYGQTYVTVLLLSSEEDLAEDFEADALDVCEDLQDAWASEKGNVFRLEYIAYRSFEDEFTRAIVTDIPLVPAVFILMSILCVIIFAKRDKVRSQSLLGFGAVVTVLLAIMTSFGLLFICGVPFTNLTPILPFILFGVGLDDAFIISGSYARTDPTKDVVGRIEDTTRDVGNTILLTTITAAAAFGLGGISSIQAVFWLMAYAFPTIIIDFIYQITFFMALIVLDDKRQKANRRDCFICCKANPRDTMEESTGTKTAHFADDLMARYADFLMKPRVKVTVIVSFAVLLGLCSWSTSQLEQYFDFTEVIPSDSYIQTWFDAYEDWYERSGARPDVYFRDVDFSSQDIQQQMEDYVNELAELEEYFSGLPPYFWLWDFRDFVSYYSLEDLSFNEQVDAFLENETHYDQYNDDIVRNKVGNITASRTGMHMDNVDNLDVHSQTDALKGQRKVTRNQPINERKKDWHFFTFAEDYYIWEFYSVAKEELILTTVLGVATVALLGLVFIPHWSAILWVGSLVSVLYIDLLGFAQVCGINVNPVMYIAMVMSIGLMIDYVFHVTLRFVEIKSTDRHVRTKHTLKTIGASVMVGGLSTMLGVIPLAFASSEIFFTVFIIFFGLVVLGLAHGLILLPVLLSIFGPVDGPGTHEITEYDDEETKEHSDHENGQETLEDTS